MAKELQYDFHQTGNSLDKAIVAIHGWQGDRHSMRPLITSMKIQNAGWYLLEAPYPVKEGNGWSWSYEISEGKWEVDEPKQLLGQFFSRLFEKFTSENIQRARILEPPIVIRVNIQLINITDLGTP